MQILPRSRHFHVRYKDRSTHNRHRGADKSLARPGRKQPTATNLQLLHATQKNSEDLRGSNDLHVGREVANFQLLFQSGRAKDLSASLSIHSVSAVQIFVIFKSQWSM